MHGHSETLAVWKVHVAGPLIGVPAMVFTPETVTVYVAPAARAAPGVNTRVLASGRLSTPATEPPEDVVRATVPVFGASGALNRTVTGEDTGTFVAPGPGSCATGVGTVEGGIVKTGSTQ